jgi:hypothetical protein
MRITFDTVPNLSSPSHLTKDIPSQVTTQPKLLSYFTKKLSTTKKLNHCLENQKGYYLGN